MKWNVWVKYFLQKPKVFFPKRISYSRFVDSSTPAAPCPLSWPASTFLQQKNTQYQ